MSVDAVSEVARRVCAAHQFNFVRRCNAGAFKHTFLVTAGRDQLALKLVVGAIDHVRVQREVDALRACNHENISRLITVGTTAFDGRQIAYFVEEFLDGGTLAERLRHGVLAVPEGRSLALSMARSLAYLAKIRIVHRDIKPDNIMFRGGGTPVLIDLGIARHLTASSLTKEWVAQGPGTPVFAAPEQLLNQKNYIDWRTDQFGLGVTLSIAMLGIHPYSDRPDLGDVVDRVSRRDRPIQTFLDTASARGLEVLVRMTSAWPIKRFTRPTQLIEGWERVGIAP